MSKFRYLLSVSALGILAADIQAQNTVRTDCLSALSGQECGSRMNTITTAVPFLNIGPDSRSGGMGDAGVALSADANAVHWNPSKLIFAENQSEFRISVSPWLRNLVPDMTLSYLSFFTKLKNKRSAIGGSLRYFNLGDITFTDITGRTLRDFRPAEFAVDVVFSQKFSDRFAGGISLRYINSNLTAGINATGANTKAGQGVAADISMFYTNDELELGGKKATLNFGLNISNLGNKISYSETATADFIPMNLRVGPALTIELDEYNTITFSADVNKLLVPTPPIYATDTAGRPIPDPASPGDYVVLSGRSPNRGIMSGLMGSFTDAPGELNRAGTEVLAGSVMREELRELYFGGGFEYWYAKQFAFRGGYFWEHATKGNRKYLTMGMGVRYKVFSLDFSYLIANQQRSPLANTLRFTLGFNFDGKPKKSVDTAE